MIKKLLRTGRRLLRRLLLRRLLSSLLGALVLAIILVQVELNNRPDLSVWHTTVLDEEFSADSEVGNFTRYLELETRLFAQLDEEIYRKIDPGEQRAYNRYYRDSSSECC
jgi:hypothetical protein